METGLYKWECNGTRTTDTRKRVIYFDNIRIGDENASYGDLVKSAYSSITPLAAVKSFTLVNAETEKDLVTITDGSVIDLSALATKKINIRANVDLLVGSVQFVLSGRQNRSYEDDAAPYALNGDNEKGNYYSGSWDPPPTGNYTLEVTPFSDDNATGLIGKTSTINFKIIE